ncbi:30S ribosomal protein S16 [Patescibacteria group bacterium]|nr:30S ribosomal protein S16 [Patescibacteria group bacterium]
MSIKIRLTKTGKKNAPAFRVVVSQTRTKRNGKFLDILGDFNPTMSDQPNIDRAKVDEWVKKGARITEPVQKMLSGTYKYEKYNPKAKAATKEEAKEASA